VKVASLVSAAEEFLASTQDCRIEDQAVLIEQSELDEAGRDATTGKERDVSTRVLLKSRHFGGDVVADDVGVVPASLSEARGDNVLGSSFISWT
jgi:hypothetical protein